LDRNYFRFVFKALHSNQTRNFGTAMDATLSVTRLTSPHQPNLRLQHQTVRFKAIRMSCVEVSFPKEKPIASGMALCLGFIARD